MSRARGLDDGDLANLRLAAEWGLLRNLGGRKVCLTGKMSMERSQMAALIEAAGGVFTNTMSTSVSLLVMADDGDWTTKMDKASAQGALVLRESEFVERLLPSPAELLSGVRAGFDAPRAG